MNGNTFFKLENRTTPFIAAALHDGHFIDETLRPFLLLDEAARSREEDPYTWYMIEHLPVSKIKVNTSRFQTDMNRTKDKCIYKTPGDAWGLNVWQDLPQKFTDLLLQNYDTFYDAVFELVEQVINKFGYIIILDVHSYNHRRESPHTQAPQQTHPDINLGTAYNHGRWKKLFGDYTMFLSGLELMGSEPDARENIIFKGGGFAQQLIKKYGDSCGVLSVEFKKTFMDEWTGVANITHITEIKELLSASLEFLQSKIKSTDIK